MKTCMKCGESYSVPYSDGIKYDLCRECARAGDMITTTEQNAERAAWAAMRYLGWRLNDWSLSEVQAEYERRYETIISRFRAQVERAELQEAGVLVDATFWHRGQVFYGSATRQPDGTWNFAGVQDRTFANRKASTLIVTGMTRFSPRYQGKHLVERTGGKAQIK